MRKLAHILFFELTFVNKGGPNELAFTYKSLTFHLEGVQTQILKIIPLKLDDEQTGLIYSTCTLTGIVPIQ